MLIFNKKYFIATILLLLIEVFIALFVNDHIIRPYVGDFLVVILVYSFIRTFLQLPVLPTVIGVLLFSYTIEFLQYLNLIDWLRLRNSRVANLLLGNYFEWIDMLAYTLGVVTIIVVEKMLLRKPLIVTHF